MRQVPLGPAPCGQFALEPESDPVPDSEPVPESSTPPESIGPAPPAPPAPPDPVVVVVLAVSPPVPEVETPLAPLLPVVELVVTALVVAAPPVDDALEVAFAPGVAGSPLHAQSAAAIETTSRRQITR
jgi:hypothetical protein